MKVVKRQERWGWSPAGPFVVLLSNSLLPQFTWKNKRKGESRALEMFPSLPPREQNLRSLKLQDAQVCISLLKGNLPVLDLYCRACGMLECSSFLEEAKRLTHKECSVSSGWAGMQRDVLAASPQPWWAKSFGWRLLTSAEKERQARNLCIMPRMIVKISPRAGTGLLCLLLQSIHHLLWQWQYSCSSAYLRLPLSPACAWMQVFSPVSAAWCLPGPLLAPSWP